MSAGLLREIDGMVERKRWKTLTTYFLFFFFVTGGSYNAVASLYHSTIQAFSEKSLDVTDHVEKRIPIVPDALANQSTSTMSSPAVLGVSTAYVFNEGDWSMSGFKKEKDNEGKFTGYVCAKKREGFDMSEMWHKNKGMKVGEILRMRYSMKKTEEWNEKSDYLPKLVLLYGRKNNGEVYYRMFIPDEDPDRIGFEDNSGSKKIWPKSKLDKTLNVVDGGEISLEYEVNGSNSNSAAFNFKLNYIADMGLEEGGVKEIKYEDSFPTRLPWPSPHENGAEQDFGIGIYPETCIQILSYENPANITQ